MNIKIIFTLMIAFMPIIPSSSFACDVAGPNTHVGNILKIDNEKQSFTIFDVQTMLPIKFRADKDIMDKVINANGTVFVNYEIDGAELVATGVKFE